MPNHVERCWEGLVQLMLLVDLLSLSYAYPNEFYR